MATHGDHEGGSARAAAACTRPAPRSRSRSLALSDRRAPERPGPPQVRLDPGGGLEARPRPGGDRVRSRRYRAPSSSTRRGEGSRPLSVARTTTTSTPASSLPAASRRRRGDAASPAAPREVLPQQAASPLDRRRLARRRSRPLAPPRDRREPGHRAGLRGRRPDRERPRAARRVRLVRARARGDAEGASRAPSSSCSARTTITTS